MVLRKVLYKAFYCGEAAMLLQDGTHPGGDVPRFSDCGEDRIRIWAIYAYGSGNNPADNGSQSARGTVDGCSARVYDTWYGHRDMLLGPYVDSWIMYGTFNKKVNGQERTTVCATWPRQRRPGTRSRFVRTGRHTCSRTAGKGDRVGLLCGHPHGAQR